MTTSPKKRPASTGLLRLPQERLEQLREIARVRRQTMVDVISYWINAEIAAGTVSDELPGFHVWLHEQSVVLGVGGNRSFQMTPAQAISLANTIDTITTSRSFDSLFDVDAGCIVVGRRGPAVALKGRDTLGRDLERLMTAGVARDLARWIRGVAAEAELQLSA